MDQNVLSYFLTQGPWAALFVWLLYTTKKESRELLDENRAESREREKELHEVLHKFSEKYDLIIDELRDLKAKVDR